jgi:hypothetical protein
VLEDESPMMCNQSTKSIQSVCGIVSEGLFRRDVTQKLSSHSSSAPHIKLQPYAILFGSVTVYMHDFLQSYLGTVQRPLLACGIER